MVRDETLSRSFMLLSLGAAVLLLTVQWQFGPSTSRSQTTKSWLPALATQKRSPVVPQKNTRLVVDLSDRRVYVYRTNYLQTSYPVAVGQAGWETPAGSFQITQMDHDPVWQHPITGNVVAAGPDNPLGTRWIGFWSDGQNAIGFHGTDQEDFVGQAVSHGCLRMRNRDIQQLYEQVDRGTPVIVRP